MLRRVGVAGALVLVLSACSQGELVAVPPIPQPVETPVETPADEVEPEVATPEFQPLDGGSHTFMLSAVTFSTKLEDRGEWVQDAEDSDYLCPTCPLAPEGDRRFLLTYTISVPENYAGTVDLGMFECPGELTVTQGIDPAERMTFHSGDLQQAIEGPMFAGSTKSGVMELHVPKAYVGQEFMLPTTCANGGGEETAYFRGALG